MTVDEVRNKVQRIIADEMGVANVDSDGDFIIQIENAVLFVSVNDFEGRAIVETQSYVLCRVPLTAEVYEWVATDSRRYFSAMQVLPGDDGTGDLHLAHALLGDFLDRTELMGVIAWIAMITNDLIASLQQRFGGLTYIDVLE